MRPSYGLMQRLIFNSRSVGLRQSPLQRVSFLTTLPSSSRAQPFLQPSRAFSQFRPLQEAPVNSPQKPDANTTSVAREPPKVPSYDLTFTCKPCSHRSTHRVTKQGYHHGTVLITCPSCKNRHVITDHLRVFNDKAKSFEEILMEKAAPGTKLSSLLQKGTLGFKGMTVNGEEVPMTENEAIEFWEEGREASERKHRSEYKKGEVW